MVLIFATWYEEHVGLHLLPTAVLDLA